MGMDTETAKELRGVLEHILLLNKILRNHEVRLQAQEKGNYPNPDFPDEIMNDALRCL